MCLQKKISIKICICTVIIILGVVVLLPQAEADIGQLRWVKIMDSRYFDYPHDVAITSNFVMVAGRVDEPPGQNAYSEGYSFSDGKDRWIVHVDSEPANSIDRFHGVAEDPQGNIIYTGKRGDFLKVWKYKPKGTNNSRHDLLWFFENQYGSWSTGRAVAIDEDGDIYVCGSTFRPESNFSNDWVIVRLDPNGDMIAGFPIIYDHGNPDSFLGDTANDIAIDSEGNFIVVGAVGMNDGSALWHVRKYASSGALLWNHTYEGSGPGYSAAQSVAVDDENNILVAGYITTAANTGASNKVWLVLKYAADTPVDILWEKIGPLGKAHAVEVNQSNDVLVGGEFQDVPEMPNFTHWRLEELGGADGTLNDFALWGFHGGITGIALGNTPNSPIAEQLAITGYIDEDSETDWYTALYDYQFEPISPWPTAYSSMFSYESDLQDLRRYRDLLVKTDVAGQFFIRSIYQHSDEILQTLLENPELLVEAHDLIEENIGAVNKALKHNSIEKVSAKKILKFLDKFEKKSPPKVKRLTKMIKANLKAKQQKGQPFLGFNLDK